MKVYYVNADGRIIVSNYDKDDFIWKNTIAVPYSIIEIDEVDPENKELCIDLVRTHGMMNINGDTKYYVSTGELYVRDNWEEYQEELI